MYEACHELFAYYPLAAGRFNDGERSVREMILILHEGDQPRFFVLSHSNSEGRSFCSLRPWGKGGEDVVNIEADSPADVPDVIAKAVAHGFPIPQDGSLFGWNDGGTITALTTFCAQGERPSFTTMPLAGLPERHWPLYTDESLFGRWFWDSYRAGKVVSLAFLVAATLGTVYWVPTESMKILDSDCCAVACDVGSPDGLMLPRGRYVYHGALRTGMPVPSLTALLHFDQKIDLGPPFQTFM
jgi:hypothetical protein